MLNHSIYSLLFFFNDTATTEIYTLSLHDALPIYSLCERSNGFRLGQGGFDTLMFDQRTNLIRQERLPVLSSATQLDRSEEHTSELQSHLNLVCRLLLEKKTNIEFDKLEFISHNDS